jgi:protease I
MDGVEEAELTQPVQALTAAGASVDVISQNAGTIRAFRYHTPSIRISIDKTFDSVSPDVYDALLLPGGALNADVLRVVSGAQAFATAFDQADKPIAAICHAPRPLASANLLAGRTLASFHAIHDDLENAGGTWCDAPGVNDGSLPAGSPATCRSSTHA